MRTAYRTTIKHLAIVSATTAQFLRDLALGLVGSCLYWLFVAATLFLTEFLFWDLLEFLGIVCAYGFDAWDNGLRIAEGSPARLNDGEQPSLLLCLIVAGGFLVLWAPVAFISSLLLNYAVTCLNPYWRKSASDE